MPRVYFGANNVLQSSKKQSIVLRYITEVEYRVLDCVTSKIAWLESLLGELQISLPSTLTFWCENMSICTPAANPICHDHTKHLELNLHYPRQSYCKKSSGELSSFF